MNKKIISKLLGIFFASTIIISCYSPNPIYGKWADNIGNVISFFPDLTFSSKIYDTSLTQSDYSGSYNVIENIMVFNQNDGRTIMTEWDIRGSILYITWTTEYGETISLSLYRISK